MSDEARIRELLSEVYLPEGVEVWLNSRNRSLGMEVPAQLISSGRFSEVLEVAKFIAGGAW